ncbi:MAG: hypothetical protein COY42_02445 [Armatimonadetes bacterium CG_4_10_14_0_8_um_filter_66_14]|nr:hypothetical protein [Armatimonadota bacterium]PIX49598.1 MAG: hypothetical protein COZ57_03050 [Armatimonadetes bacterium CG_4_8_14_3_um_filter_66_20]PIZ50054.1 MAG: hypothetical protein COY42_02445 [Armatimonadetes bacterium CG_4_10_14_0_8_um_filter_66_14]PJB72375.1 MAG: hypothetical protein CO096_07895 [Armatimonadetes bacterium CG_4_9_14_3_um_filter_66_14]
MRSPRGRNPRRGGATRTDWARWKDARGRFLPQNPNCAPGHPADPNTQHGVRQMLDALNEGRPVALPGCQRCPIVARPALCPDFDPNAEVCGYGERLRRQLLDLYAGASWLTPLHAPMVRRLVDLQLIVESGLRWLSVASLVKPDGEEKAGVGFVYLVRQLQGLMDACRLLEDALGFSPRSGARILADLGIANRGGATDLAQVLCGTAEEDALPEADDPPPRLPPGLL